MAFNDLKLRLTQAFRTLFLAARIFNQGQSFEAFIRMLDSSVSRLTSHASASCSTPCALYTNHCRKHSPRIHMQPRIQSSPCLRQTSIWASEGKDGKSFNPFRNKKKEVYERYDMPETELALNLCLHGLLTGGENMQDAAKKALEDMFGGRQDMLAAYDAGGGNIGRVRAIERGLLAPDNAAGVLNQSDAKTDLCISAPIWNLFKNSNNLR